MKIAYFDIESTALYARTWDAFSEGIIKWDRDWQLLCFSYKEPGKKEMFVRRKNKKGERELVKKLWKFLDEYDVIIAHNGRKFDVRKSNAKFLEYGLKPPSFYQIIDTYTEAKKYFALTSYKLDSLARLLGLPGKAHHNGFDTWEGCERDDPKAWKVMERYSRYDCVVLEKVYEKMEQWIHQKKPLVTQSPICPDCGGVAQRRGVARSKEGLFQRYQCKDCASWFQGKQIVQKYDQEGDKSEKKRG
ncbi:MAG: ribonuclease H-like domain-containing protein [Candidatus Moraniibacteriota bacterium]